MHASHRNVLAVRVDELSAEEARLLELLTETRERLEEVRGDLAESRSRLINVERFTSSTPRRGKPGRAPIVASETVRRVVHELRTFTLSELAAELGTTKQTARRYLDPLLCMVPPMVVESGRAMGQQVYEFSKPTEPGEAFEAQQRLRAVANDNIVARSPEASQPVAGTGANTSLGPSKTVNELRREASRYGVRVEREAGGHLRWIAPNGEWVRSSSTPSASSMKRTRAKLRRLGVRV